MKKRIANTFMLVTAIVVTSFAQNVAVVDIQALLDAMPQYKTAQTELDKTASEWRQEISLEMDKIKSMYNKYQAEQVLLSDEMRKQREEDIVSKEREVMELQKMRFGPEGDLFKRRKELVKPIQDKVMGVINTYANGRGIDLVLDKNSSGGILFLNDKLDKTEDIKKRLKK